MLLLTRILSLLVISISIKISSQSDRSSTQDGHFAAYVRGGDSEVQEVIRHLEKRGAYVINHMRSSEFGSVVNFHTNNQQSRRKRSLSNHKHITAIEPQEELVRVKRDYNSKEEIDYARSVIEKYLAELEDKKQTVQDKILAEISSKHDAYVGDNEPIIEHDKQRELPEPLYYSDKSVYKRFRPSGDIYYKEIDARDYDPNENRCNTVNLNDEHWAHQWYLNNCNKDGRKKGKDINVVPAWQQGFTGQNVTICILDDGIEHKHDDIKDNYWSEISANFNAKGKSDDKADPSPNPLALDENSHGTRCAGEIAAKANNSVCGVGVAFNSRIGGVKILDGPVTDSLEASALLFKNQIIDIYSASWGPKDNGKTMEAPGKHCSAALKQGVTEGRGGKGSIFVWATGNGGYNGDDCAADGYVSSPYTLSIGSINDRAESTYFMEWCPSTMAVIYTGGYHSVEEAHKNALSKNPTLKIVTTDVRNRCTLNFQGTSSAAPLAAGVMALALEANPNLTWRDVQHIVVRTSKIPNTFEKGWTINGAGFHINDKFGYGVLDAAQMVQEAQGWSNVGPQHNCTVKSDPDLQSEFGSGKDVSLTIDTDGCQKNSSTRVDKLEHVQMHVKLKHPNRGSIKLTLTSPAGTRSEMLSPRRNDDSSSGIDFTFMTVRCWGENPRGKWTLTVSDTDEDSDHVGVVIAWSLTLLGTAQSTVTREAADVNAKAAYEPDTHLLQKLMNIEKEAAVNVEIKKGSEKDVIESFSVTTTATTSKDESTDAASGDNSEKEGTVNEIKTILKGMSKERLQTMVKDLKSFIEEAKKKKEEKKRQQIFEEIRGILSGL